MKRHLNTILLLALVFGQLFIHGQYPSFHLSIDLFYLVIFYVSIKMGFLRGLVAAVLLGLLSDYLSLKIMGVFPFARVLASYALTEVARFIDLRKNLFVFTFIGISLFLSNLVASFFFSLIGQFPYSRQLLVQQPLLTAAVGTLILLSGRMKDSLHVY